MRSASSGLKNEHSVFPRREWLLAFVNPIMCNTISSPKYSSQLRQAGKHQSQEKLIYIWLLASLTKVTC